MPLSALHDTTATPVDWWFAYKLPNLKNPQDKPSTALGQAAGTEYFYCDAASPSLKALSPNPKILEGGALFNTLQQLRDAAHQKDPDIGWVFYNDEHAKIDGKPTVADNSAFGHTKGVLAFDLRTKSAFWLLHSWPCFPSITPVDPPSPDFGQTFLCVTLKDLATVDAIAKVFVEQTQPQIIGQSIPTSLDQATYPNLVRLSKTESAAVPAGAVEPSDTTFTSKAGASFRLFAKSKDWLEPAARTVAQPKDLYADLIGPHLKVNLAVETWQDGEPDDDSDGRHTTEDILYISLHALGLNDAWNFTDHDHSKWAVSMSPDLKVKTDWVIVADINRVDSQYERGGCAIAFKSQALALSLHAVIDMKPPAAVETLIAAGQARAVAAEKARDAKRAAELTESAPKQPAAAHGHGRPPGTPSGTPPASKPR